MTTTTLCLTVYRDSKSKEQNVMWINYHTRRGRISSPKNAWWIPNKFFRIFRFIFVFMCMYRFLCVHRVSEFRCVTQTHTPQFIKAPTKEYMTPKIYWYCKEQYKHCKEKGICVSLAKLVKIWKYYTGNISIVVKITPQKQ